MAEVSVANAIRKIPLALRFKRTYKPYTLKLLDVRSDKYLGTETPKDYSSIVHLTMESTLFCP